eukprot:TRINITY_DN9475_c0_g1_i1.p1 TRINITY_DN9475_c0_g1~~TRINITY_DN9475_c0_g1_i1.p1  ORF type:complete len:210 (+),score=23.50 TRINITY_DN9475_c0_g1_i1:26-655(+)
MDGMRVHTDLYEKLSQAVEGIMRAYASIKPTGVDALVAFQGTGLPSVSIQKYLQRIHKYANCSDCCFAFALIYIDRIAKKGATIHLNPLNIHRVIFSAIVLGIKFYEDTYYDNKYYSKIGGIPLVEMNKLEAAMLILLDFDLHVFPEEFSIYVNELHYCQDWEQRAMGKMVATKGFAKSLSQDSINTNAGSDDENLQPHGDNLLEKSIR